MASEEDLETRASRPDYESLLHTCPFVSDEFTDLASLLSFMKWNKFESVCFASQGMQDVCAHFYKGNPLFYRFKQKNVPMPRGVGCTPDTGCLDFAPAPEPLGMYFLGRELYGPIHSQVREKGDVHNMFMSPGRGGTKYMVYCYGNLVKGTPLWLVIQWDQLTPAPK